MAEDVLWGMSALEIITIAAVLAGPILAVLVTRFVDHRREIRDRRMALFRNLMRTRRMRLHPDHVGSINLIEIEFDGVQKVLAAFKRYSEHLNTPSREDVEGDGDAWIREQDKRLSRLLHCIGDTLGFKIEQLDIFDGGYTPEGWNATEAQQSQLRWLLIEWLKGNRAVPITERSNPQPGGPFPPPPPGDE